MQTFPTPTVRHVLFLFLVAFLLRAGYGWTQGAELISPDEKVYHGLARSLVESGRLETFEGRRAQRVPGYPAFLAAHVALVGDQPRWVRLSQAALGAGLPLLLIPIGISLGERRAGWWAAWAAAAHPQLIYYAGRLLSEAVFPLGVMGTLAALHLGLRGQRRSLMAGAGLILGVAHLIRPTALAFLPWCLLAFWVVPGREAEETAAGGDGRPAGWRRWIDGWGSGRGWGLAGFLLGFLLVVLPWGVRNRIVLGHFTLLDTNGGYTLLIGSKYFHVEDRERDPYTVLQTMPEFVQTRDLGEWDRDQALREAGLAWVRAHPGAYAALVWRHCWNFWRLIPRRDYFAPSYWWKLSLVSLATDGPLLVGFVLGLWWTRRRWRAYWLLMGPPFLLTVAHGFFYGLMRYRLPVMPILCLFAAVAVGTVLRRRSAT